MYSPHDAFFVLVQTKCSDIIPRTHAIIPPSAVVGQVSQDLPAWGIPGTLKRIYIHYFKKKKTSSTYSIKVPYNSSSTSYPDSSTSSPRKHTACTLDECPRRTVTGNGGGRALRAIARLVVVCSKPRGRQCAVRLQYTLWALGCGLRRWV